jgi:hypothetical protein
VAAKASEKRNQKQHDIPAGFFDIVFFGGDSSGFCCACELSLGGLVCEECFPHRRSPFSLYCARKRAVRVALGQDSAFIYLRIFFSVILFIRSNRWIVLQCAPRLAKSLTMFHLSKQALADGVPQIGRRHTHHTMVHTLFLTYGTIRWSIPSSSPARPKPPSTHKTVLSFLVLVPPPIDITTPSSYSTTLPRVHYPRPSLIPSAPITSSSNTSKSPVQDVSPSAKAAYPVANLACVSTGVICISALKTANAVSENAASALWYCTLPRSSLAAFPPFRQLLPPPWRAAIALSEERPSEHNQGVAGPRRMCG